jgi:aspartyl-tRNA(Asn)/glutamyl-tRNA(Gln) amidotransferase subunit C
MVVLPAQALSPLWPGSVPSRPMSQVSEEEIRSLAGLARLALSDVEVVQVKRDLEGILEHMDALAEVNTDGVEPMTHVLGAVGHMRSDEAAKSLPADAILAAAPAHDGGCFDVPAILPPGSNK